MAGLFRFWNFPHDVGKPIDFHCSGEFHETQNLNKYFRLPFKLFMQKSSPANSLNRVTRLEPREHTRHLLLVV